MGSRELSCGGESLQNPLPLPCPSASCLTNRTSCKRRQKVACEPRGVAVHPYFLLEVGIKPPPTQPPFGRTIEGKWGRHHKMERGLWPESWRSPRLL